jgi:hypothetical protein
MNYIEINQDLHGSLINITTGQYDQLENLLKLDSLFLKGQKLMDYSLLLVIEKVPFDLSDLDSNKN